MRRGALTVVLAVLVTVAAAACSSSSGSGDATTTTTAAGSEATTTTLALSPEMRAYVDQVQQVCRATNALMPAAPTDRTPQASQAYIDQILAVAEQQVSQIEAVTPPAGEAAAIQANFTGPMRATLDGLVAAKPSIDAAAAQGWDQMQAAASDAGMAADAYTDANTQWMQANGLYECGGEG